jgi:putative peptidoglycan lipid II flippase
MAISAAELPTMSRAVGTTTEIGAYLRSRLSDGLDRIAYFIVPSVIAFLALGDLIVLLLFQSGKFQRGNTIWVWQILIGSTVGLLASTMGRLYSSTFYALRDTRTPFWFALARVVLTAVLGYLFAFPLPRMLGLAPWTGAAGLTASAGIAGWLEFLLLRRAITARIGATGVPRATLALLWGASLAAGGAGWGVMQLAHNLPHVPRGLAAIGAFALVYGVATLALGVPEARALVARIRRR